MLKLYDGKIGTREFIAIFFFSMAVKATDTTPDLLIFSGKNAAWIIPILSFLIILLPYTVILKLLKKYQQGLIDILFQIGGKAFGYIVGMTLFLITLFAFSNNSRSYADIVNEMYYAETPLPYIYLCLIITTFFVTRLGLTAIGGTSWLSLGILNVAFFLLFVFVLHESNWLQVFPILGPGIQSLAIGGASYTSLYADLIFLTAAYPYARSFKDFRIASYVGLGLVCFWLSMFLVIYTIVYNYPAVEYLNYPFHQITRIVSIGGMNTHFESFFLGLWIISTVLHFAIYLYVLVIFFTKTLKIQRHERLFLPFAALIILLGLIPENTVNINKFRILFIQFISAFVFLLPFVLWILDLWRGKHVVENN